MARSASIVIAHASIGSGHRVAAEAVAAELESLAGPAVRIDLIDALEFGRGPFARAGRSRSLWAPGTSGGVVRSLAGWWVASAYRDFLDRVTQARPSVVVCTHPLPALILSRAVQQRRLKTALVLVATGYGTQRAWQQRGVALYCVADTIAADELLSSGIRADLVHATGIPVRSQFTLEYDLAAALDHFNLPAEKRVILALAGSASSVAPEHFLEALTTSLPALASIPGTAIVVVTGSEDALATDLKTRSAGFGVTNVHVLGLVEHMAPLMAVADVALSVPRGAVCAECLAMGTPLVLVGPASGEDLVNAERLTEAGAALFAPDPRTIAEYTRKVISKPARLARMSQAAAACGRPFATTDIAERVLALAGIEAGEAD
jgi:processive 1,2-diacylglycerol beta-glucosyltransferase